MISWFRCCALVITTLMTLTAADSLGWCPAEHPATRERSLSVLLRAEKQLDLAFEVAGRLQHVDAIVGQIIPPGASMALDERMTRAALVAASAALAQAEAEAAYRAAERERTAPLNADGTFSAEQQAVRAFAATTAMMTVERFSAEAIQARLLLERYRLILPEGWSVAARLREPGAVVQAGEAILRLYDTRTLVGDVRLDAQELSALTTPGQPANVIRSGSTTAAIQALRVLPVADPISRKFMVEAVIANTATAATLTMPPGSEAFRPGSGALRPWSGALRPGSEATLTLRVLDPVEAWIIPTRLASVGPGGISARTASGSVVIFTVLRRDGDAFVVAPDPALAAVRLVEPH